MTDSHRMGPSLGVRSPRGEATEVAEVIHELVRDTGACPEAAVVHLRALLRHELARRNPGRLRLGHLELVIIMLRDQLDSADPFVSSTDYAHEQQRRAALGERYPDESTLRKAYGKWVKVVRAAADFLTGTGRKRVPHSYRHAYKHASYEPLGIINALLRARDKLEGWPSEWGYAEWAELQRMLATTDPRLPNPKNIRKAFGSFDGAVRVATAFWDGAVQDIDALLAAVEAGEDIDALVSDEDPDHDEDPEEDAEDGVDEEDVDV